MDHHWLKISAGLITQLKQVVVFAGIHSVNKLVLCLPLNMKVVFVKTLIFSHFNYSNVVNDMTVELSDRLQHAQHYSIQCIFNLRHQDYFTPFFNDLTLLSLKQIQILHTFTSLYSVLYNKSHNCMPEWISFISGNGIAIHTANQVCY